jgi:hypothetical protein
LLVQNIIIMKKVFTHFALLLAASTVFVSCSVERNSITRGGAGYGIGSSVASSAKAKQQKAVATEETVMAEETIAVSTTTASAVITEEKAQSVLNNTGKAVKSSAIGFAAVKQNSTSAPQNATQNLSEKSVKKSPVATAKKMTTKKTMGDGSGWGIASLACGVLGFLFLPILFGPLAIIFGALGLNKKLKGLAIAGLVLGFISLVVIFLLIGILLAVA